MYVPYGRRKVENRIFGILEKQFCSLRLLRNPRTIDVVDEIERKAIRMYMPNISYVEDYIYAKCIIPRIQMFITSGHNFKVTDEGNIILLLPLLENGLGGEHEKRKEIQYNAIEDGMEKVSIFDYRRYGIDRLFKSIRSVYDKNGIEIERQIEMLKRDEESVQTLYFFKERLKEYPNIVKITQSSRPSKQNGKVNYYDIRNSEHVENLDEKEEDKIEEKDIKPLTEREKEYIISQTYPIYRYGMSKLVGIDIEHEER